MRSRVSYPTCPQLQYKITCRTQNQENLNLNEKRQSADASTSMTQMLELSGRDVQAAFMKVLQRAVVNSGRK